jgi:hypothetical protein
LHTLLLGCINTNQLRQEDITLYYQALWPWVSMVKLAHSEPSTNHYFLIDANTDNRPLHCSQIDGQTDGEFFYLNTNQLVSHIKEISQQNQHETRDHLSTQLLNHLLVAWKIECKRDNNRVKLNKQIEICCGLFSVHFHCANQIPLKKLVNNFSTTPFEEDENPFLSEAERQRRMRDIWDKAYEASINGKINGKIVEDELARKRRAVAARFNLTEIFQARAVDASENGYRLRWCGAVPPNFKSGEVLGFRENPDEPWKIAFIRWVQTGNNDATYGGIEFIANSADAWGAQILSNTDKRSKFVRALVLPEDPLTGRLGSVLLPAKVTKRNDKIFLCQNEQETTIKLNEELEASALCNRFCYQHSTRLGDLINEQFSGFHGSPNFEGVWDKI